MKDSAAASKIIREFSQKDGNIRIIGHFDADGLSGAGLMGKALLRQGANFSIRIAKQLDEKVINNIAKEKGIEFFISKPFNKEVIYNTLDKIISG